MKLETQKNRIHLPSGIRGRLHQFQRRVHVIKMAEGVFAAIFGLALSYCILFVLDRIWNTPSAARWFILLSGSLGLGVFLPLKFHRWVWCQRKLKQVAKLLRKSFPRLGDQLLGVIELANNDKEQERSSTLVKAAMIQVDESTRDRDFNKALYWVQEQSLSYLLPGGMPFIAGQCPGKALIVTPSPSWMTCRTD
jgi:hypothetical protein